MGYVVAAHWYAKAGKQERLREVIEEMTEPSQAEPGNLYYAAQRSIEDPQYFFLYEVYADEAAYKAHRETEHFTRLVTNEATPELLERRERTFYETLA